MPEEYLNELKTKLNSGSLKLEDAIHLSNLPEPSAIEWFVYTDEFQNLYEWHMDPAWKLYDTLVEQDNSALSNPAVISTMLMRVQEKPDENRLGKVGGAVASVSISEGLNLSGYEMVKPIH